MSEKRKQMLSKKAEKATADGSKMRKVTQHNFRDADGTALTFETVTYEPFTSPTITAGSYTSLDTVSESIMNSTREQSKMRMQSDADLWDMLSFRGMTFADAVAELNTALYEYQHAGTPIPVNVLERFGMCVIRATFKDLVAKGADEYQTAVYDDFRHDLRVEMSRRMAEDTAYEVNRNRKGDTVRCLNDEQAVRALKNNTERFGSGMDLMHAIIVKVLDMAQNDFIESMDATISSFHWKKSVHSWKGEAERLDDEDYDFKEVNAVNACFKACRDEIDRQASIKAVDNGYTYISLNRGKSHGQSVYLDSICADDRDGYEDERIYFRTKQNIFTGGETNMTDHARVAQMISEMHLTEAQMRRLEMKARGYSIEQIAGEENTSRRAIQKSIEQVRAKAIKWLTDHGTAESITEDMSYYAEAYRNAMRAEQREIDRQQAETEAEAEAQRKAQAEHTHRGAFLYWKNRKAFERMQADESAYDFNYYKQGYGTEHLTKTEKPITWSPRMYESYWRASTKMRRDEALGIKHHCKLSAKARQRKAVTKKKHSH